MDEIINRKNIGFSAYVNKVTTKKAIFNTLGEKRALTFITAIISSVTNNEALQKCDPQSIISGALLGESLNLSSSVQLGQYYLVPYKNKATFQLGYKGYIQLAMRSGNYRKIISQPIKNGELISYNPLEEEIKLNPILEDSVRENTPTIGYYAMFEYINGFKKSIYWSKTKMQAHAKKYSKSYGSGYSFWDKDFDAMACKTMLRQLISKWGIMSTELQVAYTADQSVINADGSVNYIDSNIVNNYQENRKVVDVL
jgi:recombination protein RecT